MKTTIYPSLFSHIINSIFKNILTNLSYYDYTPGKRCLNISFIMLIATASYSQKVTVKDDDRNILVEFNDEGRTGSIILLPSTVAPLDQDYKLYNLDDNLYWHGLRLITEFDVGEWTLNGLNLYPSNLSSKVGIGIDNPTRTFEVQFNTGSGNVINPIAWFRTAGTGNSAGSIGFQNTNDNYYTVGITQGTSNDFAIAYNKNISLSTDLLRLKSNGFLDIKGKLKIGDDLETPSEGVIRYTTSDGFEGYDGSAWLSLGEGGKWLENGNDIYYNNGNVGVGTNTPIHEFQVEGNTTSNIRLSLNNLNSLGNQGLLLGSDASTDGSITLIGASNPFVPNLFQFRNLRPGGYFNWVLEDGEKLSLDPSGLHLQGDLGVGTTTPSAKTHVVQDAGGVDAFRVDDEASDTSPFIIKSNGAIGQGTTIPQAKMHIIEETINDAFRVDDESGDDSPFIIKEDGKVGIGDVTPSAKTHIKEINAIDVFRVDDKEEDATPFIIKDDGKVGIGLFTPSAKTHVVQDAGGVDAFRVDDEASDTSPFIIKSNGAIGQGTTIPQAKMHIIEETVNDAFRVDDESGDDSPFIIKEDGKVGVGTQSPHNSAKMEMQSTKGGILIPRMTEVQRDGILSPAIGLLIYQTDNSSGFYSYDGGKWKPMNVQGTGENDAGEAGIGNNYGTVVNSITGKVWLDRNLGATRVATSSTDDAAYGDLYQWGRGADGHQVRTSPTDNTVATNWLSGDNSWDGTFIIGLDDWLLPKMLDLWSGTAAENNPCPSGFRLPTNAEWNQERLTWSSNDAAGAFASQLKLTVSGYRDPSFGSLFNINSGGYYWSSTIDATINDSMRILYFGNAPDIYTATVSWALRAVGCSIRCIKD